MTYECDNDNHDIGCQCPGYTVSELKDTNPKDAMGVAKVPLSTVSGQVLGELGLAMMEGALKYGRHNYRVSGVRASVYFDAAWRHLIAFYEGEDIDPASGLPHIIKVMACMAVLRDSQIQSNWVDDRPPKTPSGWIEELNTKAKALLEKYPDPVEAYTELGQQQRAAIEAEIALYPTEYTTGLIDPVDHEWKRTLMDPSKWTGKPVDLDEPPVSRC